MTTHAFRWSARALRAWWVVLAMSAAAFVPGRLRAQISPGPLARAHAEFEGATNCVQCHGLKREPMSQMCLACHKEIAWLIDKNRGYHPKEVKVAKKECASCHPDHAGTGFKMIEWPGGSAEKFDHQKAGWLLDGKHADTKCEKCHATKFRTGPAATLSKRKNGAGWVGLETDCITCHKADDVHKGDLKDRCESCHDAKDWTHAPKFDHDKSDYPLTGKHVDVECDECHITPKLPVRQNADGERVGTFSPVPFKECSSCHADPHKGNLGSKCGDCHVTRGFQIIDKTGFNHQVTKYPLRGKHVSVACEKCHGANLVKKTMPFAKCIDCHTDSHKGEATLAGKTVDCASCHKVEGFTPSTYSVAQHQTAKYALEGRHATVKCALCHKPVSVAPGVQRVARIRVESSKCSSCHQDAHGGETAARADGGLCESCHTVAAFAPSSFDVKAHAALKVTLEGRHGQVPCAACHGPARPGLSTLPAPSTRKAKLTLVLKEKTCDGCHVDPHAGRYNEKGTLSVSSGCATCHNAVAWRPSTLTLAVHATFSYPLDGGHRTVPCVACHDEMKMKAAPATLLQTAKGVASLPFTKKRATTCVTCHETPHGDQFAHRKDKGVCEGCHTVETFIPAVRFNHDKDASFALAGAHAKVPCASCHKANASDRRILYRPLSGKCESCHAGTLPKGDA